jgi:predicted transcriptional regulator
MTPLKSYEQHHKVIHSIYSSRLKIQILLSLLQKNEPLSALREVTGSTSQALIPKIRSLESQTLIEARSHEYFLTPFGKIIAEKVADFVNIMAGINRHKEFWSTHDLSGLPEEFLSRIGDLQETEVKLDTQVDILTVYSNYLRIVKEAAYIHGISCVMSPGLAETLSDRVVAGIPVELIVNEDVTNILKQEPYIGALKHLTNFPNFKVWVTKENRMVGLTVTDKYISLGLFKLDGKLYDSSSDLFSGDPYAVAWGEDLFRYYRERSKQLEIEMFVSGP